jgi:hypothetical protein
VRGREGCQDHSLGPGTEGHALATGGAPGTSGNHGEGQRGREKYFDGRGEREGWRHGDDREVG